MDNVFSKINDLVWESVRRNESYKHDYKRLKNRGRCGKYSNPGFNYKWSIKRATSPSISSYRIRRFISKNPSLLEVHPYYNQHEFLLKDVVENINLPDLNGRQRYIVKKCDFDRLLGHLSLGVDLLDWTCKTITNYSDRIIVAIDPYANDKKINSEIQQIRTKYLQSRKLEKGKVYRPDSYHDDISAHFSLDINIGDLDSYFCHLRRYDIIVDYCKVEFGEEIYQDGEEVCRLPKKFSFSDFVDLQEIYLQEKELEEKIKNASMAIEKAKSKSSKKYLRIKDKYSKYRNLEGEDFKNAIMDNSKNALIKRYRDAYKSACNLIRAAPRGFLIVPSRIENRSQ